MRAASEMRFQLRPEPHSGIVATAALVPQAASLEARADTVRVVTLDVADEPSGGGDHWGSVVRMEGDTLVRHQLPHSCMMFEPCENKPHPAVGFSTAYVHETMRDVVRCYPFVIRPRLYVDEAAGHLVFSAYVVPSDLLDSPK